MLQILKRDDHAKYAVELEAEAAEDPKRLAMLCQALTICKQS